MITLTCENCGVVYHRAKGSEGRGRFCTVRCGRAAQRMPTLEQSLWRNVAKTATCWMWTGARASQGYGRILRGPRGGTRQLLAHRVSYELHVGPIPKGKSVCHRCDNPACVRPDHLWLGSQAENNADRDQKGRKASKLTPDQVIVIRASEGHVSAIALGRMFGVTRDSVYDILRRRTWRDVP